MFRRLCIILAVLAVSADRVAADDAGALAAALRQAQRSDWAGATAAVRDAGTVTQDVVEWQRLRAGDGSFQQYVSFIARRADWPGLPLLRQKGEAAIGPDAPAAEVIAYFAAAPQTGAGALALARALRAAGDPAAAEAAVIAAWATLTLGAAEQTALVASHGDTLRPHHAARLDAMLWRGELADARRMLALVGQADAALARARIALQSQADGVDAAIAAVPADRTADAGLARDRYIWRIRKDRYDEAGSLLLERSADRTLGQPEAWAEWRATLARREMRQGDPARAYRMAAWHGLSGGSAYADLEWIAGYVALRRLGDPATALRHFRNLRVAVTSPISLGRAGYWEGRAHEAMGDDEAARAAYAYAAEYQSGFYGLLAAERAGLPMDAALAGGDRWPDWRDRSFAGSSLLVAATLARAAGDRDLAERFVLHLAETLPAADLGALADLMLEQDLPHLALLIAKQAAARGVMLNRAYYPVTGLARLDLPVPAELALAIARRESEFDPAVVSSAGARGLMQVMPGTAKLVAPTIGLAFAPDRLTADPAYNARIGSAYLAGLRAEFGPSPLLVAAGYNAGPGRPRRWIAELGDPRRDDVDPVDWIEAVPFTETRNYIMRVTESLVIYRARLAGGPVPLTLTDEMKGRLPPS